MTVIDLDSDACADLLQAFIDEHPEVWDEDIGESERCARACVVPVVRSSVEVGGRIAVHASRVIFAAALASLALVSAAKAAPSDQYLVRNLVSSTAAVPADRIDPNIKNPWGLVSSPTSPWWPANNGTNTSTIIPATGAVNNTVVSVAGGPTGIVWNGTAGAFPITGGQSNFIFNTMSGAVSGWRAGAVVRGQGPGHDAFYMGLALAVTATGPQLYSADFKNNQHRGRQRAVGAASTCPASSSTRRCPPTTAPYGIQTVGNRIFVTYAEHDPGRPT